MLLDEIVSRNAVRYPDKPALVMGSYSCTWAELDLLIDQLANAFLDNNLKSGDRVAVLLSNCPEYLVIYFAAARTGLIAVPVNYRLAANEMATILQHADPSLLIAGGEYHEQLSVLETLLPALTERWVLGEVQSNAAKSYTEVVTAANKQTVHGGLSETDTLAIFYTSGTTGLPKGAMVSHYNLEMNAYNQFVADGSLYSDVNLIATPLYHMGAVFMATTYMMLGCTQYIMPKFTAKDWLENLQSSSATVTLLIPTMINAILNEPTIDQYNLSSIRLIFYGGGPMPSAVLERAIQYFACDFTQGYGLTETLEATFLRAEDHVLDGDIQQLKRLGSAGREAVGAEVRIVDGAGRDLPADEIGEILIKSRSVINGYWKMPEETAAVIRNGWFYTGDLGYLDEDRYLFIVDRKKDMVVSGGENIYTKEIESVLYQHPGILEAAVFGLPDDEWGEIVTAAVVIKNNMQVSPEELIGHCRKTLASYKKPRKIFFLQELPKNPSGKILKRELRQSLRGLPGNLQ